MIAAVDAFYAEVLQHLRTWSAPPPKLRDESPGTRRPYRAGLHRPLIPGRTPGRPEHHPLRRGPRRHDRGRGGSGDPRARRRWGAERHRPRRYRDRPYGPRHRSRPPPGVHGRRITREIACGVSISGFVSLGLSRDAGCSRSLPRVLGGCTASGRRNPTSPRGRRKATCVQVRCGVSTESAGHHGRSGRVIGRGRAVTQPPQPLPCHVVGVAHDRDHFRRLRFGP